MPVEKEMRDKTRKLLKDARWRSKQKGIPYSLTREWLTKELRRGKCAATGLPFSFSPPPRGIHSNPYAPSIDRRDSSLGYTCDNCHVVCWAYNNMKSQYDEDLILKVSEGIKSRRAQRGKEEKAKGNSKEPKGKARGQEGKGAKGKRRGSGKLKSLR